MLKNIKDSKEAKEMLLSLLPTSGTLAGIAIGLAGVINSLSGKSASTTIADEVLIFAAMGFLLVCYLIFFAIRLVKEKLDSRLLNTIDVLFLSALTLLVFAGFITIFEIM